jgi:hypothetical protein
MGTVRWAAFSPDGRIADGGYIIVHGEIAFEGRNLMELQQSELVKGYYLGISPENANGIATSHRVDRREADGCTDGPIHPAGRLSGGGFLSRSSHSAEAGFARRERGNQCHGMCARRGYSVFLRSR